MESEKLIYKQQWVPTIESAGKAADIAYESFYNSKPVKEEFSTNLEYFISLKGNFQKLISNCGVELLKGNKLIKSHFNRAFNGKLENEYTYKSVFLKSGGLLNIFNSRIKESEDDLLEDFKLKYDRAKAITLWLDSESEFFSGLSPKLVWAGAGKTELKLTYSFMEKLSEIASNKKFSSQGECTGFAMQQLRAWEFVENKECNNQKPRYAIIEERQEIFKKKVAILKKYNIKNDFEERL